MLILAVLGFRSAFALANSASVTTSSAILAAPPLPTTHSDHLRAFAYFTENLGGMTVELIVARKIQSIRT